MLPYIILACAEHMLFASLVVDFLKANQYNPGNPHAGRSPEIGTHIREGTSIVCPVILVAPLIGCALFFALWTRTLRSRAALFGLW